MQPDRQAERHASTRAAGAGDPLVGRLIDGRYRVAGRIARGGMASVYEATDIRLDRTVALKVMHPGLGDDDEFAARFVREARAAARLSHPHVVAVYDQGQDDGVVYLAMELVAGHTLRDVIREESPMPPARALALMEPVLSALAAAHRAGLIHRDVKPENVLIAPAAGSEAKRVKVADFGLAKAVSADTQHTATGGVLIGTVSYLAPELVVSGRADARADVYAAGVMLFELLTGAKPHEGETPIQVAYQHVHHDVPAPSTLVPGLPAYVDALVARATARDRELRPADAGVLLHQVRRVAHALAEGVTEDAELTADLTPLRTRWEPAEAPGPDDTAPEIFDTQALATIGSLNATTPAPAGPPPAPPRQAPPSRPPRPPAGTPAETASERAGRPRRRRRGLVWLIVALLLVVGGGAGAWWFLDGRYTATPGVVGLTKARAAQQLERAGLEVRWGKESYSETVPVGRVVSTDPQAGAKVLDGGTVTASLSLGPERYDVPALQGKPAEQAQAALEGTKLALGRTIGRWSDTVPVGTVIATTPKAGTTVRPDTAVDLVVSKGPQPVKVKDWVGKDADKALAWFRAKGLEPEVADRVFSDDVDAGDVISQTPEAGATAHRGDRVSVVVSRGPELVEVPSVRGQGVAAATERLEGLGFKVRTVESDNSLGLGFVWSQSPGGGKRVPKGSTITLTLI